jgi:hypothetical protein
MERFFLRAHTTAGCNISSSKTSEMKEKEADPAQRKEEEAREAAQRHSEKRTGPSSARGRSGRENCAVRYKFEEEVGEEGE